MGGSPASKSYMWAKPKVSVFKNGQFRDPFFLRKICFFWKKQKLFSPVNNNFFFVFWKNIFSIFFEYFFYEHFFWFSDTFLGGFFCKTNNSFLPVNENLFFHKNPSLEKLDLGFGDRTTSSYVKKIWEDIFTEIFELPWGGESVK